MKRLQLFAITSLIILCYSSFTKNEFSIIGKWEGEQRGNKVTLIFNQDQTFEMIYENGKHLKKEEGVNLTYSFVQEKKKYPSIDLMMTFKKGDKVREWKILNGIIEIINNDEINIHEAEEGEARPKKPLKEDDGISTFKRIK